MADTDLEIQFFQSLEKTVEAGLSRLHDQNTELARVVSQQNDLLLDLRERNARMETEIRHLTNLKSDVSNLREEIYSMKEKRAMERGLLVGAGGVVGWFLSLLSKWSGL